MNSLEDVEAALNDSATEEQRQRAIAALPILAKLGQWGKASFVPSLESSPNSQLSGVVGKTEPTRTRSTWISLAVAASLLVILSLGVISSWKLQARIATLDAQIKSQGERVAEQGEGLKQVKDRLPPVNDSPESDPVIAAFEARDLVGKSKPAQAISMIMAVLEQTADKPDLRAARARLLGSLGACYVLLAQYGEAEAPLLEAKSILEHLEVAFFNDDLADCNLYLARLYVRTQQFDKGVAHCYKTLATYREARQFSPYVPQMHDALGVTFFEMDKLERAANEFKKASTAASLVNTTPFLQAVYLYNYGVTRFTLADYAEAETPLSNSLNGFELFEGGGTADTLKARALLGQAQLALGELRESERTLRPLLAFKTEGDATTQVEIIVGRSALGAALVQQGSIDEGISIARTALADIEGVVGKESGYYANQKLNLAALLLKTDDFGEGEEILLARLEKTEQENESELTASILYNLGLSSSWRGNYEEAKGYYARARKVPLTASSNVLRGRILSQNGTVLCQLLDFEEGITLQKEGVEVLANSLPLTNPIFVNERNNLVVSLNRENEQATYSGQLAIATSVIDGKPLTRT